MHGKLTIHLASVQVQQKYCAKMKQQSAELGESCYFNSGRMITLNITSTAGGNWDTNTLGNDIVKSKQEHLVGGTQEVKGDYSLSIDKDFKRETL